MRPIFTANVPVLKIEINPSINLNEFTYLNPPINYIDAKTDYSHLNLSGDSIDPNITIKVDISIEENFNNLTFLSPIEHVG